MATTNINVNKQTVLQLLTSGQDIPFVILSIRDHTLGPDDGNYHLV